MFDLELIKHTLKYELKWGKKKSLKATTSALVMMIILPFFIGGGEDSFVLLVLLTVLISICVSSSSSLAPISVVNDNHFFQRDSFSWNYLHPIIHDRKSFIVALGISGVVMGLPTLILGSLISLLFGADLVIVFLSIPVALLILFQLKLNALIQSIEMPRRIYFKYSDDSEMVRFFRTLIDGVHKLINSIMFLLSIGLVCALLIRVHIGFAVVTVPLAFLFTINYSLNYLLKIWKNENYSFWNVRRELKKTTVRALVIAISVVTHYVFFGLEIQKENKAFHLVEGKKLNELKSYEFKENDLNRLDSDGYGLIHLAIKNNDIESVKYLVSKGSSIETPLGKIEGKKYSYKSGFTPLMFAIDHGAVEIAQFLIENGAKLNKQSPIGLSAISLAVHRCHPSMVKLLNEKGANIEITSETGNTPIFYTVMGHGCLSAFIYLKESGANLSHINNEGLNYLQFGKKHNRIMIEEVNFYLKTRK